MSKRPCTLFKTGILEQRVKDERVRVQKGLERGMGSIDFDIWIRRMEDAAMRVWTTPQLYLPYHSIENAFSPSIMVIVASHLICTRPYRQARGKY